MVRCTSLYKVTGIPVNKLFGTILLERAIDLVLLLTCICLSFLLKFKALTAFFGTVFSSTPTGEISSGKLVFIAFVVAVPVLIYLFREQLQKSSVYQKIVGLARGVKEGFQTAFHMKQKGLFAVYTLLIWSMYLLMTYICFFSIAETMHLTLADGLYITVIGGLGMIVPVQGGLGPYHAAVTLGIVSIGLTETTGATLAVLIHSAQTIMILITGIIAAIVLSSLKEKQPTMNQWNKLQAKVYTTDTLQSQITDWSKNDQKIVFTNGCFDLLHLGHVDYLAKARDLGDKLIIGLNTDASVSRIKGPSRPVKDQKSRATILAAMQFVDAVIFFDEETPLI